MLLYDSCLWEQRIGTSSFRQPPSRLSEMSMEPQPLSVFLIVWLPCVHSAHLRAFAVKLPHFRTLWVSKHNQRCVGEVFATYKLSLK